MSTLQRVFVASLFIFIPVVLAIAVPLWSTRGEGGASTAHAEADRVERGRYLVSISACTDCHTPHDRGVPDPKRHLAGHPAEQVITEAPPAGAFPWIVQVKDSMTAWSGPWGVSFTRNLTPDKETGLGAWTEENFVTTMREMRHMGLGRPLLPPMPAIYGQNMTDEDLKAIYAYLRTIPAVHNRVPDPLPPAN